MQESLRKSVKACTNAVREVDMGNSGQSSSARRADNHKRQLPENAWHSWGMVYTFGSGQARGCFCC